MQSQTLTNLREALNRERLHQQEYTHEASRIRFTLRPISQSALASIDSAGHYDPIHRTFPTPEEIEREKNILYLLHGVLQFEGHRTKVEEFYDNQRFGGSNTFMIEEIKKNNPSPQEKIDEFIIVLAFNQHELNVLKNCMDAGLQGELSKFLTGQENVIEAMEVCSHLFRAYTELKKQGEIIGLTIEEMFLIQAKPILRHRGFPQELWINLPDPPKQPRRPAPQ